MAVTAIPRFERFFRAAAGLDIDKDDLRRYTDFINEELADLLLIAETKAKANGRDIIERHDLPVTKGLQERIHEFEKLDEDIELRPVLVELTARPPLTLSCSDELVGRLPVIAGGLSLALARTMKIIYPELKVPGTEHWNRSFAMFDLLM
jgi:hypothetical protein